MIKAIAFDIGGVLCREEMEDHYPPLAKIIGFNMEDFLKAREKYVGEACDGKISSDEYLRLIARELKIKDFNKFKDNWISLKKKAEKINKDIEKILIKLKDDYFLVAFTNIIALHHRIRKEKGFYKYFNLNVCSFLEGCKKPEPEFYDRLIDKLAMIKISPDEILFIDDKKHMLEPAKKLGMKTIYFENASQLRKDLAKFGVKV
jgi:HAD superfamily hydrolase (TIGR01509 family)